jgi:hypothetical protein
MRDVDTTWAGAALTSGSWTGVWGQWVIPTISKPREPQATNLDGWTG